MRGPGAGGEGDGGSLRLQGYGKQSCLGERGGHAHDLKLLCWERLFVCLAADPLSDLEQVLCQASHTFVTFRVRWVFLWPNVSTDGFIYKVGGWFAAPAA